MKSFSASAIYVMARSFEQLRSSGNFIERANTIKFSGDKVDMSRVESIELLTHRERREFLPGVKDNVLSILDSVAKHCEEIDLGLAATAARDYREGIESGKITTYSDLSEALGTLDKIIMLQLRDSLFMFIPTDRASYYAEPQLFGDAVSTKFPECQFDIEESGSCFAAGRGTACAFHLMRIMEIAVQRLGATLGIALTQEKNWQNILDEINKAIKVLPPKDTRTIALSQAAGHLYNVKVAWRNPTMHPKITYTLEEAADLIAAVKGFMNHLAEVI
jgi:hypothetical protein